MTPHGARQQVEAPLTLVGLFEKVQPLEVEIGCGKAKFLLARAQEERGINFIGVDRARKWLEIGRKRAEKRGLTNVRFLHADIRDLLPRVFSPSSVAAFHVYFPDPWPKRRHRKRRLMTSDFLALLHRCLEPNGKIYLATDDEDYFASILINVQASAFLWQSIQKGHERWFYPSMKTNYELKYEAANRPLYYLELVKRITLSEEAAIPASAGVRGG